MAKLKPVDKKDIIKMLTEGVIISKIAHCFNVDPKTIRYVINNYKKYGESSLETKTVVRKKTRCYDIWTTWDVYIRILAILLTKIKFFIYN